MKLSFRFCQFVVLVSLCWGSCSLLSAQDTNRRYLINSTPIGYQQDGEDEADSSDQTMAEKINPLRKPMSSLTVDVQEFSAKAPMDKSNQLTDAYTDTWSTFSPMPIGYAWTAPNIRYQPLFFENVRLERYGQTRGPWREVGDSSLHFFGSLALLPYHARFDDRLGCDYPLGFCRPGNRVPATRQLQWWGW